MSSYLLVAFAHRRPLFEVHSLEDGVLAIFAPDGQDSLLPAALPVRIILFFKQLKLNAF